MLIKYAVKKNEGEGGEPWEMRQQGVKEKGKLWSKNPPESREIWNKKKWANQKHEATQKSG